MLSWQLDAREVGLRFAARRRRVGWLLALAGLALAVGGFAGFGVYGDHATSLQKHGVHTTATVTVAALYGGRYSRNSFTEHIDVDFVTPAGVVRGVRIPIGESDRFRVGQQVEVSYDPTDPHRAVLAHGYADIGPVGFPLFFAIVIGLLLVGFGIAAIRLARGARRALEVGGRTMKASSRLVPRGRGKRVALVLMGGDGEAMQLWTARQRGWYPLTEPIDVTVFGSGAPGSVAVVVDSRRGAATGGRVWKPHRLPFSSPRLAVVRPPVWQAVLLSLVAASLAATIACAVWLAQVAGDRRESARIQAGPRVAATVVAADRVSGGSQDVTIRYRDRSGVAHRLELRFPLGLASSILPGTTTTVAYDPRSPARAELAGHPRTRWEKVAYVGAGLAGLLLVTFCAASAVWHGLHRERAHPHHVAIGLAGLLTVLGAGTWLVVLLVSTAGAQELPFPPNPPPPAAGRAAPLPPVLSLAPPRTGELLTPAQAHRIVEAAWPFRDRLLARHDLATLEVLEAGPALAVDAARLRSGDPPNRPDPPAHAPSELAVYVPMQRRWPVRFLAEGVTTSAGQPFLELLIFSRDSTHSPWRVVYDTGYGRASGGPPLHVDPVSADARGYDIIPSNAEISAADAVPALARYWQSWIDHPSPPRSIPPFVPGTWTTDYGESMLGKQGEVDANGHPAHVVYGDRPAPAGELWTFGVYGRYELVCSPLHQTTTWSGGTRQDKARSTWGPDLAPGAYRTVTAEILREPCILVPAAGSLVAFGADRWVIGLTGRRS